jgi:prevent-host-death family protein
LAKAKFAQLVVKAQIKGAQFITRGGKPAAVLISTEGWSRRKARKGTLVYFFMNSPLRGSKVKIALMKGGLRMPSL